MYLLEGDVNLGNEAKVARYENNNSDWQRNVVDKRNGKSGLEKLAKEEIPPTFCNSRTALTVTGVRGRSVRGRENSLGYACQ
jgi:hypothetical protein